MDQSRQNPNHNGADISSSFPITNQSLVPWERSRQMMAPLAAIARPEPNLLWPSQFSHSYTQMPPNHTQIPPNHTQMPPSHIQMPPSHTQMPPNVSIQNVLVMPPYSTGNVSPVHEAGYNANQSTFMPNLSPHLGSHLAVPQPFPYNNQGAFHFNSYAPAFHAPPMGFPIGYSQHRIASTSYYNNGAGSFSYESSLAGALSHTSAINGNQNQIMSNNLDSGTPGFSGLDIHLLGHARIDIPFDPDTRISDNGESEDVLSKKDVSLQSLAQESINFQVLDEILADDSWKNEASNRILQTFLTSSNTINSIGEEPTPVSIQVAINSPLLQNPVLASTAPISDSLRVNQRESFPFHELPSLPMSSNVLQSSVPETPRNHQPRNLTTPSSGSANRATLARDILWALQPASLKRKRRVNEDHTSVVISNKKSKVGNIDPPLSDVVPPSNQPDKFATESEDLRVLPSPDVLEVDAQTLPPLSLKNQLDQPVVELNDNLLPSSPRMILNASDIKDQTSVGILVESRVNPVAMESSNSLPLCSPSVCENRVRTPLFLPSESPSPSRQHSYISPDDEPLAPPRKALLAGDKTSRSMSLPNDRIKVVRKNIRPYVLVPKLRSLLIKKKELVASQPPGRGKRAVESEFPQVQDSRSRLAARRCLWRDCSAILDSAEKLIKHTKVVHGSIAEEGIYKCHWADCRLGTYFTAEDLRSHLKRHVQSSITCPYEGCAYETKRGDSLVNHIASNHATKQDFLKPLAIPIDRSTPKLVDLIKIHPAYYSIPIPIMAKQISRERHSKLGPLIRNQVIEKCKPEKHNIRTMTSMRSSSPLIAHDYDFQQEESASRTFGALMQVSPTVDEFDVVEGSVVDSVVILEVTSDGNFLPKTALNAKIHVSALNPSIEQLEDGLGIDLGPNLLQTAREENESLEVDSLL